MEEKMAEMMAKMEAMEAKNQALEADQAELAEIKAEKAKADAIKAEAEAKRQANIAEQIALRQQWETDNGVAELREKLARQKAELAETESEINKKMLECPHKVKLGGGGKKRHAEGSAEREAQDKKLERNDRAELSKKNLFCKYGTGVAGNSEPRCGGPAIMGCRHCARSKATMEKHEAKCKWADKARPWETN